MKRIGFAVICTVFVLIGSAYADQTRMDVLMAGDYVDDIINIGVYPHQLLQYQNSIYGDIKSGIDDYGLIMAPIPKFGAFGVWQDPVQDRGFNIGYAVSLKKFEIGISGSPGDNQTIFGVGIGRLFFDKRFDVSFLYNDTNIEEWFTFNLRLAKRKGDYIIMPRYSVDSWSVPYEYYRHRIGLMLERIIFNDGFIFFIAEYDLSRGDIENDNTHIHAGLDLPVSRKIALLLGVKENFIDGFDAPVWSVEPGISIRIRDFTLDFHLNQDRLYDKDVTLFNSFGLELNFGRF
jgi:hypothetical protein